MLLQIFVALAAACSLDRIGGNLASDDVGQGGSGGSAPGGSGGADQGGSGSSAGGSTAGTGGAAGTGGTVATGGTGGTAGAGLGGAAGVQIDGHDCSLVYSDSEEPGGRIPVCCSPTSSENTRASALLALINTYRTENGREPLHHDEPLAASMQAHLIHEKQHGFRSEEGTIDAPESVVETPEMRAEACGTSMTAWIYYKGTDSEQDVFDRWKDDPKLDGIILNQNFVRAGVAMRDRVWGILLGKYRAP
jgi:hypothetical protein